MRPSPDVVVVGGGLIGCAVAIELAAAGARVTVLERGQPGGEASAAAAGMLGPRAECDAPGPLLELGTRSLALHPAFIDRLRGLTGIDPEYQDDGILYVALDDEDERLLAARAAWQARAGFAVERLSADDARLLEPRVCPELRAAVRFPDDHRLDNVRLTRAAAVAAAALGVTVRAGVTARALVRDGDTAVAVEAASERVRTGAVVNAAGAWAGELAIDARTVPVRPVRGQMVALALARPPFRHAIYSRGVYLVPRRDGRVLAGSTYEDAGFDKRVTAEALGGIVARALRLAPTLADASFAAAWAGLRPGTPDALPILGRAPHLDGLFYATGHYRNGILLAPATAQALRELVLDGRTSYDLRPFAVERFARPPAAQGG